MIHAIDVVEGDGARWVVDVHCSKGTYVRTLAEDIGEALGCGAHLGAPVRTGSGALSLDDAVTLDHLEALDERAREALLLPPHALVADWPVVRLTADDAGRFLAGVRRRIDRADAAALRVHGPARHLPRHRPRGRPASSSRPGCSAPPRWPRPRPPLPRIAEPESLFS